MVEESERRGEVQSPGCPGTGERWNLPIRFPLEIRAGAATRVDEQLRSIGAVAGAATGSCKMDPAASPRCSYEVQAGRQKKDQ